MAACHIALGSNLGDPRGNLDAAIDHLARAGLEVARVSAYYETPPAGGPPGQANYLNAAAELRTCLDPLDLLRCLQQIEQQLGRRRHTHWDARTMDLDLLLYETRTINTPQLQIPHPRMHFRRFVLEPLNEIAPDLRHPIMGWSIRDLLENLLRRPLYLALAGPPGSGRSALARRIAQSTGSQWIGRPRTGMAPNDPSRHGSTFRIQYLMKCAEILQRGCSDERGRWRVSDFWLDQVCLTQQRRLSTEQRGRSRHTWQQIVARALRPTLVAWLDAPTPTMLERGRQCAADAEHLSAQWIEQERAESLEYIDRQQPVPLVRIDSKDLDAATREILAAMLAAAG